MVKQDILEPQIEPTPWVSSVTYPVKPTGEVRPCLDVRNLNKAIIQENHKPQTVEEIAHQLAGAMVFTKADALKAFLQVHLTEESSKLLVINTHKGCYRFKRMPFGAKMSQDVFQMNVTNYYYSSIPVTNEPHLASRESKSCLISGDNSS